MIKILLKNCCFWCIFTVYWQTLQWSPLIFLDTKYLIIFMPPMFCHLTQCKPYLKSRIKKKKQFYLINKDFMTRTVSQRSENFTSIFCWIHQLTKSPIVWFLNSSTWIKITTFLDNKTINIMCVCSSLGVVNLFLIPILLLSFFSNQY